MTMLKITKTDGAVQELEVTPATEYLFEQQYRKGFYKAFREDEMMSEVYYVTWLTLQEAGETVKPFGIEFIKTLKEVEVKDSAPLT